MPAVPSMPGLPRALRRAWRDHGARIATSAGFLALCVLVLPWEREPFAAALAVFANLAACYGFASTLLPEREPLITRYTRFDFGHLPPECAAYTRGLTLLWAVLLAGFALAQAAALGGLWRPHWHSGAVLAVEAALCLALFLGEHAVRNRRFPHLGPATLRRTFRAIRLAHRAGAGA